MFRESCLMVVYLVALRKPFDFQNVGEKEAQVDLFESPTNLRPKRARCSAFLLVEVRVVAWIEWEDRGVEFLVKEQQGRVQLSESFF